MELVSLGDYREYAEFGSVRDKIVDYASKHAEVTEDEFGRVVVGHILAYRADINAKLAGTSIEIDAFDEFAFYADTPVPDTARDLIREAIRSVDGEYDAVLP